MIERKKSRYLEIFNTLMNYANVGLNFYKNITFNQNTQYAPPKSRYDYDLYNPASVYKPYNSQFSTTQDYKCPYVNLSKQVDQYPCSSYPLTCPCPCQCPCSSPILSYTNDRTLSTLSDTINDNESYNESFNDTETFCDNGPNTSKGINLHNACTLNNCIFDVCTPIPFYKYQQGVCTIKKFEHNMCSTAKCLNNHLTIY